MLGHLAGGVAPNPGAGSQHPGSSGDLTISGGTSSPTVGTTGSHGVQYGETAFQRMVTAIGGGVATHFGLTKMPPGPCELAKADLPADYDGSDQDVDRAMAAISSLARNRLLSAQASWARRYPQAPPAPIVITSLEGGGTGITNAFQVSWGLAVTRPSTPYDPELDLLGAPIIPPGDPNRPDAQKFAAALRLFFPDFVLDSQTGAPLTGGQVGSMTIYGPFPRRVKYVSPAMVDLAVAVSRMPGSFQPSVDNGPSLADTLESAGLTGVKVGLSTYMQAISHPTAKRDASGKVIGMGVDAAAAAASGGYAALGAAAASLVISAFDWLFGGPPQPPAWLTTLEQMKGLRGDNTAIGGWSFGSARFGVLGNDTSPWPCSIAIVHPNPRGTMTIEEGYDEFIRRINGDGASVPWLLVGAVALGAILLTRE